MWPSRTGAPVPENAECRGDDGRVAALEGLGGPAKITPGRRLPGPLRIECTNFMKRCFRLLILLLVAGLGACKPQGNNDSSGEGASSYPSKSITLICPWAAGGGTDRLARLMADQLQKELGVPCVVVNRTGGSGAVGHSAGAQAKPDGYTVTMTTFELSTMHWMGITDLDWTSFESVAQINADAAAIVVRADAPWNTIDEFAEHVRNHPGTVKMSGTSTGGAWDLARVGYMLAAGLSVDSIRWIPSKGSAPSIIELLGGHIDSVCCSVPEALPQVEAGQLKILAVMSSERLEDFPDLPTLKEHGIDWTAVGWRGLAVPKGTPEPVVATITDAVRKVTQSPEFESFMAKNGFAIEVRETEDFSRFLAEQDAQWKTVIEAAGYDQP